MIFHEPDVEEEFWEDVPYISHELERAMSVLGDRAVELHSFVHGPGGDWNGTPDFYCCFGGGSDV